MSVINTPSRGDTATSEKTPEKLRLNRLVSPDGYFDSYTMKDLEYFFSEYQASESLLADNSRYEGMLRQGKLFERFGLFAWAVRAFAAAIDEDNEREEAYMASFKLYQSHCLVHSAMKVLERMIVQFPLNHVPKVLRRLCEKDFPPRTVTFYIPCYNVEKYIRKAIEGALQQSYGVAEILVVDDGSTDRSIAIANEYPVTIIQHQRNRGLAAARNTALHHSKGEFIASLDTDAVPDRFWLERAMLAFDDSIAGVGGRLIEKYTVTTVDRWRQVRMKQHRGDEAADHVLLFGSNTVFRVAALRDVGGYDECLRTNFEDMDVCKRLIDKGYETRYIPDAECRHLRRDTFISAINTCYNWRKPYFETNGCYQDEEWLLKKGLNDVQVCINDFDQLLHDRQFDLLYFDFLSGIRTIFRDLMHFQSNLSARADFRTHQASYAALIYSLVFAEGVSDQLIEYVREDLADVMVPDATSDAVANDFKAFHSKVVRVIRSESDLGRALRALGLDADINRRYVSKVFSKMSSLFSREPTVYKMIEASARRIRHEKDNSPYAAARKVMLLNPPWNVAGRRGVRAGSRWPFTAQKRSRQSIDYIPYPFFLCYLASVLKERDISNVIVDAIAEELTDNEFIERVAGYEPDILVMEIATASVLIDTLWLLKIKERLPDATVIWVGPHATTLAEQIIRQNPFVDFVIRGEYEMIAANLVESLLKGGDYRALPGLVFLNKNGDLVDNGRTESIDLGDLPLPERLTVPTYKYNDLFAGMQYPSLQIHASRGCPFGCIYCVWPQVLYGGRKYRTRDPERVVDEIETAIRDFGFRSFYFDDDTFNIGKERILRLCNELIRRGIAVPWGAMARADIADYEMLAAMKEAGLVGIKFGVESGDQGLVDAAGKGLDLRSVAQAVAWCKQLGIRTHLTFTFGLPGETTKTIRCTIDFAKALNPDSIQFSITTPFPGTKYFEMLKQEGHLLTEEWDQYDGGRYTVIESSHLTKEALEAAVRQANKEFWEAKRRAC